MRMANRLLAIIPNGDMVGYHVSKVCRKTSRLRLRQSEKALKSLREVAEYEGYLAEDSATFVALEARLKPNLDRDLERYKDDIKKLIAAEIVKRYYYQEGAMIENLKDDKTLQKALDVLADRELYRKTLSRPEEKK